MPDLIEVIEIEPQTFWFEDAARELSIDQLRLSELASLPQRKLVHSVGCPIGGTRPPDARQLPLLKRVVEQLDAECVSEHLSFNQFPDDRGNCHALFLLPPLQTQEAIDVAARGIRRLASTIGVPVAFETGVNYLQPFPGEMSDGSFFARVAEAADCGILLDLHNVLANERNGRQSARELVSELPLDRIQEIHLAGGFEKDGYWLDAHSTGCDDELLSIFEELLPSLRNLRAVIFEILPTFIARMGLERIEALLRNLRAICQRSTAAHHVTSQDTTDRMKIPVLGIDPVEWESELGGLAIGREPRGPLGERLASDTGVGILRSQISSFRSGIISESLSLTTTLLLLHGGAAFMESLLEEYWQFASPEPFASTEARGFAAFLAHRDLQIPYLTEILRIELAKLRAMIEQEPSVVHLGVDPMLLIRTLGRPELPRDLPQGNYQLQMDVDETPTFTTNYASGHG